MAIHACPVAEWLAGLVPLSVSVVNASYISGLGGLYRFDGQPRSSYKPKKSAVCFNFRRQVLACRQDSTSIGIEAIA